MYELVDRRPWWKRWIFPALARWDCLVIEEDGSQRFLGWDYHRRYWAEQHLATIRGFERSMGRIFLSGSPLEPDESLPEKGIEE